MNKYLKVTALSAVMSVLFSIPAFASSAQPQDTVNDRPPVESYKDGRLYLDGVPVITEEYLQEVNAKNALPTNVPKANPSGISTFGINSWTKVAEANQYSSHDWDRYTNSGASSVERPLSTTSKFTITISGETKFGFKDFVEVKLAGSVGQEYSKSKTEKYTIPAGWIYEQKSAIKVLQEDWRYTDTGFFWDTQYSASSFDYRGLETWLWSNPI